MTCWKNDSSQQGGWWMCCPHTLFYIVSAAKAHSHFGAAPHRKKQSHLTKLGTPSLLFHPSAPPLPPTSPISNRASVCDDHRQWHSRINAAHPPPLPPTNYLLWWAHQRMDDKTTCRLTLNAQEPNDTRSAERMPSGLVWSLYILAWHHQSRGDFLLFPSSSHHHCIRMMLSGLLDGL